MTHHGAESSDGAARGTAASGAFSAATVVGVLVCVELAGGILQGFYSPIWRDISLRLDMRTADVNWFEAGQLVVSALAIPVLSRLGDAIGHRRALLIATVVVAAGSWALAVAPNFAVFLAGFALQGFYFAWLPLEIALIHRRAAGTPNQARVTGRASAILVGALDVAIIAAALTSGRLVGIVPMTLLLAIPAIAVTACLVIVWFGVSDAPGPGSGRVDLGGLALASLALGLLMAGLIALRRGGDATPEPWLLVALGVVAFGPFIAYERRRREPLIDVRLVADRRQWPLNLMSALIGVSVLGAAIPMSTFSRTDPAVAGYGLGADGTFIGLLTFVYVLALATGALALALVTRRLSTRSALVGASLVVAAGYASLLVFHGTGEQILANVAIIGFGTGVVMPALPALATIAAPAHRTGFAAGMTNVSKTLGGALASAVFAIVLSVPGTTADPSGGAPPLGGYLLVWALCSGAALGGGLSILGLPRERA